jgi:DNA invertase Pin-like site-specific DNA recombinase
LTTTTRPGVDRQERICREIADRLRLVVPPSLVFVDNNRSAWRRDRKRPGWDALLKEMDEGKIRHLIAYHPDRLMRQPRDLEELLTISDSNHITLHGEANRRDLSDPDDRFILRIEVAHACRSSDDTSRRLKDAMDDRAKAGTHTGRRHERQAEDGKGGNAEHGRGTRRLARPANNSSISSLEAADTPSPSPSHCANPRPRSGSAEETTSRSGTSVRNPSAAKPSERDHSSRSLNRRHPVRLVSG